MNGRFLLFLCFICVQLCFAQVSPIDQALEYLVEFGQTENAEPDLVQLAEQLSFLQSNPISLNTATADELMEIPLLNSFLVFNFLEYRRYSGRILSYYQLADVKGFSPQLINILKPFTSLQTRSEFLGWPQHFNHQLALQYKRIAQTSLGYKNQKYSGDANALYLRYRMQADGKLFAGLTMQKDAGENYFVNALPDYHSFHFEYRPNKVVKNIVLGDFSAEFGQGLVLWSSLAFGKSSEAVTIQRFGKGLRYFSGADENRFLRGVGTTIAIGETEFSTFYSNKKVDANLAVAENGQLVATSLQQSGYHRTENEMLDKKTLGVEMLGAYAQWKPERLRLGAMFLQSNFSKPIHFADKIENAKRFHGETLTHTALDWKWLYGRLFLFGEVGYEWQMRAEAITAGMQIQAADGLQWVAQFRRLSPSWFAPYSAPFSETGREGEQGFYFGMNWQLPKHFSLAAFADHFNYLWLRSDLNRPGMGRDYMAQLNYNPYAFSSYLRFRYQERLRNTSDFDVVKNAEMLERMAVRWHITLPVTHRFTLQSRIEWVASKQASTPEQGVLAFIGGNLKLHQKWQLKFRYTIFDTKSYASAIWAFEDDVPYSYSVPAFYQNGAKWYALLVWQACNNVEFWLRISDLSYQNATNIGSGNDLIESANRTEIKALVRVSF